MSHFTPEQIKKINKPAMASKHHCTDSYVRMVLKGKREDKTDKAQAIIADAKQLLQILEPNPET